MSCPFILSLFSLEAMGCCGINGDAKEEAEEEKRAKKTNKDIERQIQKDKQVNPSAEFGNRSWPAAWSKFSVTNF
jgi:hypothetical protein